MSRVFVTGLGALSHVAPSVPELVARLYEARPPTITTPDVGGAQIPIKRFGLIPPAEKPAEPATVCDLPTGESTRVALAAVREALADAGIPADGALRVGVVLGSSNGDGYLVEQQRANSHHSPPGRWVPTFAAASAVAAEIGARGPAISVSNACAGSGYATAVAVQLIASGEADVVVAGGYETFSRVAMGVFNQVGAVSAGTCTPFARDRDGTTLGEAAAAVVLERADVARARGSHVYGEIAGQGWSCDAYHATGLDPDGAQLVRAMRTAMSEAGIAPADLALVIPHGTGTKANDEVESAAMATVFGPHTAALPVYSSKALLGHTAGASGALSMIAALTFLNRSTMAPNLPVPELDPIVGFGLPTAATPLRGDAAMVNTYAFGGNNMSLIVRKVDENHG